MTALLLSLGASLAWGVSDFGGGTAARRYATVTVLLCMRLGGFALMAALALATAAPWVGPHWPFALAAVGTTLLGGLALLRALAIGPMGITAPIVAASGAVPALAGLLGGDAPGGAALAGLAVAAAGAVIASRAPGHAGERANPAGIAYALAAAVSLGAALLLMHEASERTAIGAVLLQRCGEASVLALVALAVAVRRRRGVRGTADPGRASGATRAAAAPGATGAPGTTRASGEPPREALAALDRRGAATLLGFGAIESCAIVSYAAASTLGSLTLAAVLSSLYPVVTVLLARALHGERLSRAQRAGALLTLAGVLVVVATGA